MKNNTGSSLIESLVAMAILSIVAVSVLTGFSQQQMSQRKNGDKNSALMLAELKLEEFLKFSANQTTDATTVDYVVFKHGVFETFDTDQKESNQFRRTVTTSPNLLGNMVTIEVVVDYGAYMNDADATMFYPFKVHLRTMRGVDHDK